VGESRESKDVRAECIAECRGLGLADRRKLRGGIDDGAMVLAELDGRPVLVFHGRGITGLGQGGSQRVDRSRRVDTERGDQSVGTLAGEGGDGLRTACAVQVTQDLDGEGGGVVAQGRATARGQAVDEARTSTARRRCRSEGGPFAGDHEIGFGEGGQRATDSGCGHPQAYAQLGDGSRALHLQGSGDALSSLTGEFHNTIVSLFHATPQLGEITPRRLGPVSALEVDELRISYGPVEAVRGISFDAEAGRITALVGPNGAGKTSTLEACTGVREVTSGSIRVLGQSPGSRSARVGTMLQSGGLYPTARPLEWLTYLARLYPDARDPRELLDLVGLDPSSRTTARRMSGGEQQRLKFAAALLPRPELLFLDESTAGMDPQARRSLIGVIRDLGSRGVAVVLTTHLIADIEELADHVIVLRGGRIEASGTLSDLRGEGESFTFDARTGLDLIALSDVLPRGYRIHETAHGRYVVDGEPTPQVIASITGWLAERDESTTGIRTGRTSLEELIIGEDS